MSLRYAIYRQAARHGLDANATERLLQFAGLQGEPASITHRFAAGMAIAAAALSGMAAIFYIAANWGGLGRYGRFAVVEGLFFIALLGAWRWRVARIPMGLLAMLSIGGLLACLGQTYQTGADPWQLFAIWAALAFPLCLGVRSSVLWVPWTAVAMLAAGLWVVQSRPERMDYPLYWMGWLCSVAALSPALPAWRRVTGAGVATLRFGVTLLALDLIARVGFLVSSDSASMFGSIFMGPYWPIFLAALAIAVGMALAFRSRFWRDDYCAGVGTIAVAFLILSGLFGVLPGGWDYLFGRFFVMSIATIAVTHGCVRLIAHQRAALMHGAEGTAP